MLKELLAAGKSGDKVRLFMANRSGLYEIEAILNQKSGKSFQIIPKQ
ncbi:hypothetical protein QNI19_20005 [Cytophagaceae bacterium DM2B3-1]|uniref:Uncharacterized protein n=1 Tax=Xanthocytophaga flava TaxID=3048013 RepID=A0ABT7CRG3_9BACT|nr:hypothetical protein [Xanthocytophaga flavus]MDJ1495234.1 hypothetical protein [Xanthocytophaga flavus]